MMDGIIYFIRAGDLNVFKVGRCNNGLLENRLYAHQRDVFKNKRHVVFSGVVESSLDVFASTSVRDQVKTESTLHDAIAVRHIRVFSSVDDREWFNLSQSDVDELIEKCFYGKSFSVKKFAQTKLYASILEEQIDSDIEIYNDFEGTLIPLCAHLGGAIEKIEKRKSMSIQLDAKKSEKYDLLQKDYREIFDLTFGL